MKTWQLLDVVQLKQVKQGTQRVNKHSLDNWCHKSPPFLWSFVCSEKMFVFCDKSSRFVTSSIGLRADITVIVTLLSHKISDWIVNLSMWCQAQLPLLWDWVMRDRDNVWHCGSKLIPAQIIIRSSSDKSVMICDTQNLRDIDPASQCGGRSESFEWDCVTLCLLAASFRPLCPVNIPDLVR